MPLRTEVDFLPYVDNPTREDRWSDAAAIADRVGVPRRGCTSRLARLEREGIVESRLARDGSIRLWRLTNGR